MFVTSPTSGESDQERGWQEGREVHPKLAQGRVLRRKGAPGVRL